MLHKPDVHFPRRYNKKRPLLKVFSKGRMYRGTTFIRRGFPASMIPIRILSVNGDRAGTLTYRFSFFFARLGFCSCF